MDAKKEEGFHLDRNTFAWEQRRLGDFVVAAGVRNKDNLPLESFSVSNDRGFVPQEEQFENGGTMREADKTAYWIVEPGSFAYNPARINVGSIGYLSTSDNVIVSSSGLMKVATTAFCGTGSSPLYSPSKSKCSRKAG